MKNKPLRLLSFISTGLFIQAGANAAPLISIGDSTDVFFNGSSSLRWDSNIFRDEVNEVEDLLWTLSPGFEVNVGRGLSNANLSIITRYDILHYFDNDRLDTELFHIKAVGSYKTSRLDLNAAISFDERKSNTGDATVVQDLIESDNTAASLDGEYRVSPKFSFGAGVRYSETEYVTYNDIFADRDSVSVPLDVFYELTPKFDLSVGYTHTNTDIEETYFFGTPFLRSVAYETNSNFFNVGARGNLLPKLTGFFKIGYRTRDDDRGFADESGMLGLDANFSWAATPKVTAGMGLSRDFGVGGEGQSTENTSINLSASYSISSYWAASANFEYTLRDYTNTGREDDQYNAGLRLSYSPNQFWRFGAGYTYSENSTSDVLRSYESHIFDLSVTLRY